MANVIICLGLILFVTFREGQLMPDYNAYLSTFTSNKSFLRHTESSFQNIVKFLRSIDFSYISMFLIYAILGVGIRYYAIIKYSPLKFFSLAVWFSAIFILHDMIQIRAAVASAIFLLVVPSVFEKKYIKAIILILIAFYFHRSSIIFFSVFFLNTKKDYWWIWICLYVVVAIHSILNIDIINNFGLRHYLIDFHSQIFEKDEYGMQADEIRPNMFAPLTLIQTLTCFWILKNINFISEKYPLAKIWLKCGFLSLIIYGTGIFVVSNRLSELLSTSFIFIYPLLYYSFKGKQRFILGEISIFIIIMGFISNYIFIREFISI